MVWKATISLKSGDHITIKNLISVDRKSIVDSSVEKFQDFESFQLPEGQLSFIGKNNVVAINSGEIKYVQLSQD